MKVIKKESEQNNSSSLTALNRFEAQVREALFKNNALFKRLLYQFHHFELTPYQTSRILVVCREYERKHLVSSLKLSKKRHDILFLETEVPNLDHAGKVATMLGVVHYLGAGIEHDDLLAKQYFELAASLNQKDAWLFLGIMARNGHGVEGEKPNYSYAWECFGRAGDDELNPEAYLQKAQMLLAGEVSRKYVKDGRLFGYLAIKEMLQRALEASERLEIYLGLKRQIDIKKLITVIDELHSKKTNDGVDLSDERALKELFTSQVQKVQVSDIKPNQFTIASFGDPYGLICLAKNDIKNMRENSALINTVAEYLLRAYLTNFRLRKLNICEFIKSQFNELLDEPSLKEKSEYGFLLYCYGIGISSEFLEELSAFHGFDTIVRFYLLNDHVTSRRVRMQWAIELLGSQIPEQYALIGKSQSRKEELKAFLYKLGVLAVEALDDCLELADQLDGEAKADLIREAKTCWSFADLVRNELSQEEGRASQNPSDTTQEKPLDSKSLSAYYYQVLYARLNFLIGGKERKQLNYHGYSTALQFLMGTSADTSQLELSQSPELAYFSYVIFHACELFHSLQKGQMISNYERQKTIFELVLLSTMPVDQKNSLKSITPILSPVMERKRSPRRHAIVDEVRGRDDLFAYDKTNMTEKKAVLERDIPKEFSLGKAKGEGDCFYDSCAQELNAISGTNEYTIKSLRLLCHDYAVELHERCNKNPKHPDNWIAKVFSYDIKEYDRYLADVQYSVEEKMAGEGLAAYETAVWGVLRLDGRILCEVFNVKIHLIELNVNIDSATYGSEQFIRIHGLVDMRGEKPAKYHEIDWKDRRLLHLAACNNHFVPISNDTPNLRIESDVDKSEERRGFSGNDLARFAEHVDDQCHGKIIFTIKQLCKKYNSFSVKTQSELAIFSSVRNCSDDLLKKLQEFCDFCGLLETSRIPRSFLRSNQNSGSNGDPYQTLFEIFRENRNFIVAAGDAVKELESPNNQPSSMNFFSSTYGMDYEYQAALTLAKNLLIRCRLNIFDQTGIAREISQLLRDIKKNIYIDKFIELLLKTFVERFDYPVVMKGLTLEEAVNQFQSIFDSTYLKSDINSVSDFSL